MGTDIYMSPELKQILNYQATEIIFNAEKSDIFSLGLTYLRMILLLQQEEI